MDDKRKAPKLRFSGFTDDWEQRKLGDITSKIGSGKTPLGGKDAYVEYGIRLIRSQNIHDDNVDLSEAVYIDEETDSSMSNSRVIAGDVLLNITGASIGRSAVYTDSENANVNQHVCIIRPIKEYDSKYIQLNISSAYGQKQIESSQAGGGREGLNFQQIGKMMFMFPKIEEQKKIGRYFENLDNLITLHQRKVEQMKVYKRAMLTKMFPQNGKRAPEIRFPGFTNDWEQRKLGELTRPVKIKAGDSEYPVYSVTNQNGFLPQVEQFTDREVASKNKSNYSVVSHNQFAYNPSRINVGSIAYLKEDIKVIISPLYVVFECTDEIDKDFLDCFVSTNSFSNQRKTNTAGSVRDSLSYEGFSDISIVLPSITEQKKISELFVNIDHAITLHQRKVEQMKEYKKGLLQQMFV